MSIIKGKMLVIPFVGEEENICQKVIDCLEREFSIAPIEFHTVSNSHFKVDYAKNILYSADGRKILLTSKEFEVFYLLFSHRGQIFSKEQIYDYVWGYHYEANASNLTVLIRKLRKKIEADPDNPQYIITVRGAGYKFNEEKP